MDKNNLHLNEEALENVSGGLCLHDLLNCENELDAMKLMAASGLQPGTPDCEHFISMWRKEKYDV